MRGQAGCLCHLCPYPHFIPWFSNIELIAFAFLSHSLLIPDFYSLSLD